MNWREELRKEAEQLHKENEFYSFSATQIQQDKEYFGRFGGQELATKHQETYKRYKHLKWNLLGYLCLFIVALSRFCCGKFLGNHSDVGTEHRDYLRIYFRCNLNYCAGIAHSFLPQTAARD